MLPGGFVSAGDHKYTSGCDGDFQCAGQGESRGVKGQVQQLLQDAQNADMLCKMYVGWSAWL